MRLRFKQIGGLEGPKFAEIADAVLDFAEDVALERLITQSEKYVSNWNNAPYFKGTARLEHNDLVVSVWPAGDAEAVQHWEWVSRGTKKNYPIFPTGGRKTLKYKKDFTPKTSGIGQYVKTGMPGGKSGDFKYSAGVIHPGIAPRHFEEALVVYSNLWWGPGIRAAIATATKNL